jgi:hypothetical protein
MFDSLRGWINQNSAVVTIGAVLLLIVALVVMMRQCGTPHYPGQIEQVWFYDLNTKQLFAGKRDEIPPIETPSGPYALPDGTQIPAGVRAYVFACGDCSDESKRFIAYVERFTPEVKEKLVAARKAMAEGKTPSEAPLDYLVEEQQAYGGRLVRKVEGGDWLSANSSEAADFTAGISARCKEGTPLKPCFPKQP